jgi:ring-1,2-phenylacetyl-CoA epoxidase subunit PaaC
MSAASSRAQKLDAAVQARFRYVLRLGDLSLILGQRLGEWVGHSPALEEDLGLANIALDLIGQARLLLTYAGEVEGRGRGEDDIAFLREHGEYLNAILAEQPNGDFGRTVVRQVLIDAFQLELYQRMTASTDERLAAIAAKSVKEVLYHLRYSSGWLVRLGDGTAESHARVQSALDSLWPYTVELFAEDELDRMMADQVVGKRGQHSEHLGYMLAEMQHLQRTYPGARW